MHVSGLVEPTSPAIGREAASLYQPAKMEEPPHDAFLKKSTVRRLRRPASSQRSRNNVQPILNALRVAAKGSTLQAYLSLATECLHCSHRQLQRIFSRLERPQTGLSRFCQFPPWSIRLVLRSTP